MADSSRYYRILEVSPDASPEEIKVAWRDLVQVWHPDRFAGNERLKQRAEQTLKQINEAYERLTKPEKFAAADRRAARYEPQTHDRGEEERDHRAILADGVQAWNLWRKKYMDVAPRLPGARLAGQRLEGVDFREADLAGAVLERSDLYKANGSQASFRRARLAGATLHRAIFLETDFSQADLTAVDFSSSDLRGAVFHEARLHQAELIGARLDGADLSRAHGLTPRQVENILTDHDTRLPAYL